MKKLITLILVLCAGVMNVSAWSNLWLVSADNNWGYKDGNYNSSLICIDKYKFSGSTNDFYIRLDGSKINSGDFYFRFYVQDNLDEDKHHEVGPTNFSGDVNSDVTLSSTKHSTSNYNNIQSKSFKIAKDSKADYIEIYINYSNSQWNITAVSLYKKTVYWR